jgi:cytoskeletal protein CcmA (bactofilin family)
MYWGCRVPTRTTVPPRSKRALDNVEGDLVVGRETIVSGTGTPAIVRVSGTVYCEGENLFECSLMADRLEAEGDLLIRGDLTITNDIQVEDGEMVVYGSLAAKDVDVDASLVLSKDLQAENIDVGGSLKVDGKVKGENIDAGSFMARGSAEIDRVDVGGSVTIDSEANIQVSNPKADWSLKR